MQLAANKFKNLQLEGKWKVQEQDIQAMKAKFKSVKKQTCKVAGVRQSEMDAHHQNGVAEHKICNLQEMTRSMLINAMKRWPTWSPLLYGSKSN